MGETMRKILGLIPTCLLLGCSPAPPPVPLSTTLNLHQLMNWVIDPSADVIWDSVKSITTTSGTREVAPKTDEQWNNVRNAAAMLVEAGNLLVMEGRVEQNMQNVQNKEWLAAARRLSASARLALTAAEAKKADALFDAGGEIYDACKSCHDKYAHFDQTAPAAK